MPTEHNPPMQEGVVEPSVSPSLPRLLLNPRRGRFMWLPRAWIWRGHVWLASSACAGVLPAYLQRKVLER